MAPTRQARTRSRTLQLLLPLSCLIAAACGKPADPTPAAEDEFNILSSTKALTLTASVSPTTVSAGSQVALAAQITTTRATSIDVLVVVTSSSGVVTYTSAGIDARPIATTTPFLFQQLISTSSTDPSGTWIMSVKVRHTATGKVLIDSNPAAAFTVTGGTTPGGGGGGGSGTGACAGSTVFCDDFTNASLGSSYTKSSRGLWVRATGSYTAMDEAAEWERTRSLLSGDYTDFDVTLQGKSMGAAGFGLSYAAQATDDDGFAVIVHPVPTTSSDPQSVYLKGLVPGQQDVKLAVYRLPSSASGTLMTLRVRRAGTMVTVWLDGQQIISQDDGGTGRHGKLGLLLSITDQLSGSGTVFSLLRLDSASANTGAGGSGPPQTDGTYTRHADLTYASGDSHGMDLYVPNGTGPFPILLYIHGGGWFEGDRSEGVPFAEREAPRGYAVATIDYRLTDIAISPAQIQDVKAAVRWLRAHAADYDLDAERVAAWGESAGAHLAALLGTSGGVAELEDLSQGNSQQSSTIQAVVDWFGPTDFSSMDDELNKEGCDAQSQIHSEAGSPESNLVGCTIQDQDCAEKVKAASPITYIDSKDPPFMIMHGMNDCTVPTQQSKDLYSKLQENRVTSTLETIDGMGHDDKMMLGSQAIMEEIDSFLDSSLYP
jgi:acetyl esterase/lipase